MIIRAKKRALLLFTIIIALFSVGLLLIDSDPVSAACSGSDKFNFSVFNPNKLLLKNVSALISPITGASVPCDVANATDANLSIYCQQNGTYWANVTCAGCTHAAVADTAVLQCYGVEKNRLIIRNNTGGNIAAFDEKGYVYLKGFNHSNQASLSPTPNSYVIRNNTGKVIAYINSSGSLFITGSVSMSQTAVSAPISSFIIRNQTRKDVAYIDSSGNLVLAGVVYYNWTDSI